MSKANLYILIQCIVRWQQYFSILNKINAFGIFGKEINVKKDVSHGLRKPKCVYHLYVCPKLNYYFIYYCYFTEK